MPPCAWRILMPTDRVESVFEIIKNNVSIDFSADTNSLP